MLRRTNHSLFLLGAITLGFIAFMLYILININNDQKLINTLENSLKLTQNLLNEQKRYALSLSLLISEDEAFLTSYKNNERKACFDIINEKIKTLETLQNSHFEVQIHNKELKTYLRSWDYSIKDVPLSSFRKGLVAVKKNLKPLASIELGKRLNIKAITPLVDKGEFIGSIEVIIGFKHLEKALKQRGLQTFILLHKKYLNIADTLQQNRRIDEFVLVNDEKQTLPEFMGLNKLQNYGYFSYKQSAFSYFTYYDLNQNPLGYILIASDNEEQLNLNNTYKNKRINNSEVIIQ